MNTGNIVEKNRHYLCACSSSILRNIGYKPTMRWSMYCIIIFEVCGYFTLKTPMVCRNRFYTERVCTRNYTIKGKSIVHLIENKKNMKSMPRNGNGE